MELNKNATIIIEKLIKNGFEAYHVGGSVRNFLHNTRHNERLPIKDFDIVTNATYEEIKKIFSNVENRGESFNVAIVKLNGEEFEIAQYRGEKYPEGGSTRPSEVYTVDSLEEDLQRRDFKINGLVIDKDNNVIDLVGGLKDIDNKVISTIGDPNKRFSEDPLRMLRAIRFSCQLGYTIEKQTFLSIVYNIHLLENIPHSRVEGEISKIIKSPDPTNAFILFKIIYSKKGDIFYTNTILNKKVKLFDSILSLKSNFSETIIRIKSAEDKVGLFYSLYKDFPVEKVENELKDMLITNNKEIDLIKLLISNKNISTCPNRNNLLKLVKEMKGLNRKDLMKILEIYKKNDGSSFIILHSVMKRPLFLKELQYNGNDVVNKGKKFGYNIEGKMIGKVLEKGREQSVLGNKFNLATIFNLLKDELPKRSN